MKKILIMLGVVVLLLVIAVVVAALFLDRIVKAGIERTAPAVTRTTVTLDGVSLSPMSGAATLRGLVVGNPAGFKSASAIKLDRAAVHLSPASVLGDKVIIHRIELNAPEITFEGNPFGANNLKQLLDNLTASAEAEKSGTNAAAKKTAGKKLQVDDFRITGAKLHAFIKTPLLDKEITLPIPEIQLQNLGQGTDGITGAELGREVLKQITSATVKTLVEAITGLGKGTVPDALKGAGDKINKLTKGLGGLLGK